MKFGIINRSLTREQQNKSIHGECPLKGQCYFFFIKFWVGIIATILIVVLFKDCQRYAVIYC